jgi:Ca2+/Na+ antiporter
MLMEIGSIIGVICIILGGLLRIASLTTQKKEDKDDRMFLSQFSFVCAVIVLIPTFIFFVLLVLLPYWYGLGNTTCH